MSSVRVATFDGPGAAPEIREVQRPEPSAKAALIEVAACGVCGTDLHILKGHWPRPLPWPFTLGHELAGVIAEVGPELTEDYMGLPLEPGSKVMLPPLMPCGRCYYCVHYPETANKCLTPVYYGRYLGFDKPPHLWGGWAEMVYVDLEDLPGTKVYRLPDDMPLALATLAEPLTSCVRAFDRAKRAGGFRVGDTVVIQGSGPIGVLAVAAAQEMGAGRVLVVGAPEHPRLALCRRFGAEATISLDDLPEPEQRIDAVRELAGPFGADLVMDCSGHPSAGPEGIEMLRDGGTYVEMGQFTDAGSIETNWHRICTKDINVLGSWAFTANDIPLGIAMLDRARDRYPWSEMQTRFEFSEDGIAEAIDSAIEMRSVKSTIVPSPGLLDDAGEREEELVAERSG
ncbi:MAG: alcohol dehydrogenase catalytic domain-containing protein [Thermoleophilaceae bacterium]|nr:alcohol dehydrogenase catalytic domain-containing protein [Thermoleophilaceae bacterium]